MAQVYVWGKYNLNVKYEEDHSAHAPKQGDINNFWVGKSYSFSAVSGKYTLNNALEMSRENDAAQYPYAIDGAMAGDGVYYAEEAYGINKTAGWISSSGKLAYRIPDTLSGKIFYPVYYGAKTIKEKGVYIEDVTSESENTYPKDGISGSYYYVFKYAVPGVPSITVPGAAMIGHAVDISWEAADSAESYKLERRVDSGGWTQVYEGAGLTYADTVQVEWSNVQYRVSASISGVYGDPILSKTVNIVPSTTLRISMPEGNIGEIKGAITYTALSDAPRDAIYISEVFENTYSDYQRELTLKPGDSVTIPVSRFPSAAGGRFTVKAKVQISDNAWANENRQLSYTKTPTSMPDSPYRVERLQGKECDVMPQTLAEAVFMPDGKSVAAYMDFIKTRATVVTGSYVGTGDYNSGTGWGSSNPTSLTFDFAPKLLIIGWQETLDNGFFTSNLGDRVTSDNYYSIYTGALTTQFKQYRGFGDPSGSYAKRSSDGKTITWYATGHANAQRNDRRYKYYYLAIG
ncbi:hypothetical protein [Flavonifractor plautii]|jgi:hypothetical protein|uniref:hypothetical protein n=1 Tax=Flavonifractor plautii TaxID=292800 RepID=UPI000246BCB3|nr:hypothetical protein [Flavonifractor plautii]EHO34950.1 hypothetical protein HMPREF0995_01005 [Lachnospiraceae bacterium 7_1_58FAA]MDB7892261.1 hypothetical protein [Flavonifractor plautii]MDB7894977.1 hypothetical protein [Flavonifractor plautii]